ncbi:MAG: LysR family transcriptional regulator [Verrucomicrobiota bacterium]
MELKRLKYFVTAAHELSFSKAARKLGVSQPVLSRGIKELEAYVGTELFFRSTTEISLTAAGEVMLPKADEALLILDETIQSARQAVKGRDTTLDIAYLPVALEAFVGTAFETMGQAVNGIALRPHEMSTQRQIDKLRDGKIDIGIIGYYEGDDFGSEFDIFDICDVEMALVVPSSSRHARQFRVPLDSLNEYDFIAYDPEEFPQCENAIRGLFNKRNTPHNPVMHVNSLQSAITAVGAGSSYAVMAVLAHSIASRQVSFVSLDPGGFVIKFAALVRRDEKRKSVLAFLQECRRIAETRIPQLTEVSLTRQYPRPRQISMAS